MKKLIRHIDYWFVPENAIPKQRLKRISECGFIIGMCSTVFVVGIVIGILRIKGLT